MDAIKKKMVSLSTETDTATARANKFDDEALAASKYDQSLLYFRTLYQTI